MSARDVVVIGAGTNGLTAAILLARDGRKVLVCERRDRIGGIAASEEFHPGYRTAGLLPDTRGVRPAVVDALELGRFGLRRASRPPAVYAPGPAGGPGLLLHHDPGEAAKEIEAFSGKDAGAYAGYRRFLDRVSGVVARVMDRPPPDVRNPGRPDLLFLLGTGLSLRRLGKADMMEVLRVAPMCAADWLNEWFETDLLKTLLAGPAVYPSFTGPWSPGTAAPLLVRECLAGGAIEGGTPALLAALEKAAADAGVEIRTGTAVQRILVDQGRVRGVGLAGGEELLAPRVAASCDPRHTFLDLVPGREVPYPLEHGIRHYRGYGTVARVDLALEGPLEFDGRGGESFPFVHVASTLDAMERSFDPVKYDEMPEVPSLEVHTATLEEPSLAPEGCSVVSVLAHFVPYRVRGGWNEASREKLGDLVVRTLSAHASTLPSEIAGRRVMTPVDLEREYGLVEGHPWHGDHALDQLLLRPVPECSRYRTPIAGLFLCGSGSHPGGGVTLVPGALGARAVRDG